MNKLNYIFGLMVAVATLACSCQGQQSEKAAEDQDSIKPKKVLASIFGEIPGIYENEMKLITEAAKAQTDGDLESVRGIMANLADSAYEEAAKKAAPSGVEMQGSLIKFTVEDSIGYEITSDMEVLCAFMPELKAVGGEERVAVQFNMKKDILTLKAYYALVSPDGEVGVGKWDLPVEEGDVQVIEYIHAPNIPSKYLQACSELRFISEKTYKTLKPQLDKRHQEWRDAYSKDLGLSN